MAGSRKSPKQLYRPVQVVIRRLGKQAAQSPLDELEFAISVLNCAKSLRGNPGLNSKAIERIVELADIVRNAGDARNSPFLKTMAEALEDWLVSA